MGSWGSTIAEAQGAAKRLQTERDAQEASAARQRADLCAALGSTSSEAAFSMQHSLQVLERTQDTWRSRWEAPSTCAFSGLLALWSPSSCHGSVQPVGNSLQDTFHASCCLLPLQLRSFSGATG